MKYILRFFLSTRTMLILLLVFGISIGVATFLERDFGTERVRGYKQDFGLNERLGEYLPDSIFILNEDSVPLELNQLITKPTLLSFVYYRCPALCPKTLSGIAELINYTNAVPGKDFQVITLSINHRESTTEARDAKSKYTSEISKDIDPYFWRFFTADSITIRRLTNVVGWNFRESGEEFIHTASSTLISPDRMISQYFYGTYFNYMHFALSIDKATNEEIVPTRLKTLKYCYNYKPEKNVALLKILSGFAVSILILITVLFLSLTFLRSKSK